MYCPNCGKKLPDVAKFCTKCGQALPQAAGQAHRGEAITPISSPDATRTTTKENHVAKIPQAEPKRSTLAIRFLSESQVQQWRVLSQLQDWEYTRSWGEAARSQAAKLDPPLIPEDEIFVFDAPVNSGWSRVDIRVGEISYMEKLINVGYLTATDGRLIFGNTKQKLIFQILYEDIRAVYNDKDDYTLVLRDGSKCLIKMKVPHRSLLGSIAMLGPNPVASYDISLRERNKEEVAREFHTLFTGFFF